MLILKAVSLGPLHGYGVLLRIQQLSGEQLEIQQGSLYPALYRLGHQGLITRRVGGIGQQPQSQVLYPDRGRAAQTPYGNQKVEPHGVVDRQYSAHYFGADM